MIVSKQVADCLTAARGFIALVIAWVGVVHGVDGLPLAAWLLLVAWVTDGLDGPLARRSRRQYRSWLGDHDLHMDMAVSAGLFVYLTASGYISPTAAGLYLLVWVIIFAHWGLVRSLGMLVQAPIYAGFLWIAYRNAPEIGLCLVGWVVALVVITWPRFPNQVIPGFLHGLPAPWWHDGAEKQTNHADNGA